MSRDKIDKVIPPIEKLDRWSSSLLCSIKKGPLFSLLGKDAYILAGCSQNHHALFKPLLSLWHFLQLVARGQQQEAEIMLLAEVNELPIGLVQHELRNEIKKAKEKGMIIATFLDTQKKLAQAKERIKEKKQEPNPKAPEAKPSCQLIREKSKFPVTDWAGEETGETFVNRTGFQIAVENLDRHMYRMLLHYLPQEQARAQWEELITLGAQSKIFKEGVKILNYDLCLRTDASELEEGKLYIKVANGELYYSVIALYGEPVTDLKISKEQWVTLEEKFQEKIAIPEELHTLNYFTPAQCKILQSRILQIASASFHTADKPGTFMTKGRRKIEQLKYHLKVYMDHCDQWEISQRKRYWCCEVSPRQRHAPPHVLQEYCREGRSFAYHRTFNEPTFPRKMKLYFEERIYPLRIYRRILVITNFDKKMQREMDPYTVVVQRPVRKKNEPEKLTVYLKILDKTKFYSIDEKQVLTGCSGVVLPTAGETRDKNLIKNLLFLVGYDSGLGFGFGLVRFNMSSALSRSYVPSYTVDLAPISVLCRARSQDDLEELITDLYRKVPLSTNSASDCEEPKSSSGCTIC